MKLLAQDNNTLTENNREFHTIMMQDQIRLQMTGVKQVLTLSDSLVRLEITEGRKVNIQGKNLKISLFSKASGNLQIDGIIEDIKYTQKSLSFLKRITK